MHLDAKQPGKTNPPVTLHLDGRFDVEFCANGIATSVPTLPSAIPDGPVGGTLKGTPFQAASAVAWLRASGDIDEVSFFAAPATVEELPEGGSAQCRGHSDALPAKKPLPGPAGIGRGSGRHAQKRAATPAREGGVAAEDQRSRVYQRAGGPYPGCGA